jgi:hypothetical protein
MVRRMYTRAPWPSHRRAWPADPHLGLRYSRGQLLAFSRSAGTVRVISARSWRVRRELSLGAESEIEDIAVVGARTAYVTRRRATQLLRLDLLTGDATQVVDLSGFADDDGIPDLGAMTLHEGRLFVQIRRANEDAQGGLMPPAYLAVVDVATEQLIDVDPVTPGTQAITLQGTAPKHRMQIVPESRRLFVSATGGFFDEGGIEMIDLDSLRSLGLVVREADGLTGADLGPFIMVTPDQGYLVFSTDLILSSHLQRFSLAGGVETGPQLNVSVDYAVPALEFDAQSGSLFVPDGAFGRRGVHVFDAATGERRTSEPIATNGSPTDILLLREGDARPPMRPLISIGRSR